MLGRSSGKALEPCVDLTFDEEVPSRRVGGGRASVVRSGRTALTCRTRPGAEVSNREQDVRRLRTTGRRSGLAIAVGGRRQLRARSPPFNKLLPYRKFPDQVHQLTLPVFGQVLFLLGKTQIFSTHYTY